jgi:hypothetical protein
VVSRFLLFSAMFAAGSGGPADAQSVPVPGDGSPPACRHLMALRDEAQKNGLAVRAAGKRKASAPEACELFNTFVASETKFIRGLEENKAQCGVPDDVIKRSKAESEQVSKIRRQIREIAASRGRLYPAPDFQEPLPAPDNYFLPKDSERQRVVP